jgi:hypothetical protein
VPSEIPAIAESLVQLDKLDAISFPKGQLVSATSIKVILQTLAALFISHPFEQHTNNDQDVSGLERIWFAQLRWERHGRLKQLRRDRAKSGVEAP